MKPKLVMESRVEVATKGNVKRTRAGKILLHNKTLRGREKKESAHTRKRRSQQQEGERARRNIFIMLR